MSAASAEKLPTLPSDLTPEWLGAKLGHKIKSVENTRNIWGTASKLFYTVTYEHKSSEDRPSHICVKGIFDPKMIEAQPWTVSLAQREAEFFSEIAPTLNNMIFPRGWWSGTSDKQGIAIMNDLTTEGCSFPPEVASYPVAKELNGVEQLAGLHAMYWGQSQEDHPWIWNNYDPAMKIMCSSWDTMVRTPGRPPLPDDLMDGKRCNDALARYYSERNPRFRTLLHGDTHIGNTYFTADGRIGFLDFSVFHFGSCFHDVVYHVRVERHLAHLS